MAYGSRDEIVDSIQTLYYGSIIPFAETIAQKPSGIRTNIGKALDRMMANPCPIILVSDGNNNLGPDPIRLARNYPYPIYPVQIDEVEPRNLKIRTIDGPDYLFIGDTAGFTIGYAFSNIRGPVIFRVKINGQVKVQRKVIADGDGGGEVEFLYESKEAGQKTIEVSATTNHKEVDTNDNQSRYIFSVAERRVDLLLIANLSPDVGILRRVISEIDGINQGSIINLTNQKKLYLGSEIDKPQIIIIDNITNPAAHLPNVNDLARKGAGVIVISGGEIDLKPFGLKTRKSPPKEVLPQPNPEMDLPDIDLPPFSGLHEIIGDHNRFVTLLRTRDNRPIAFYEDVGQGRILYLLGYPFWQFYLRLAGIGREELGKDIMKRLIRLVSPLARKKSLIIRPIRRSLSIGEEIEILSRYYTPDLIPKSSGQVYYTITGETTAVELIAIEKKMGVYSARWRPELPGEYQVTAYAEDDADTTAVTVADIDIETRYLPINQQLLTSLAQATGGRLIKIDEIPSLLSEVVEERKKKRRISFEEPLVAVILMGMLSLEWFLRKREGLA